MNEPSGLAPEVVTIRDLHIRFNLGREKKNVAVSSGGEKNAACGTRYQSLYPSGRDVQHRGRVGVRKIDSRPCAGRTLSTCLR